MASRTNDLAKPVYRADIDGLRALAVLLVVFSHLGVDHFLGGFIGVDIFFVISGWLIGGIILRELGEGSFSFAAFYGRRIRRIFPALLGMLLVITVVAYRLSFPPEIDDYAQSLIWALLSGSNIFFARDVGYFDIGNQSRPLLHTWSLGVEEQFYLALPLLLFAIYRWWRRGLTPVIAFLILASFGLSCWTIENNKVVPAFFFAQMRAWELLVGTLLFVHPLTWIDTAWKRNFAAVSGLLFILIPAWTYLPRLPFPGLRAVPPCLGAVLLIAAGSTGPSWVGRFLSWRPIVFVGLISYSLYLWHWPIYVFQKNTELLVSESRHPALVTPIVFSLSLVVATISWRFIETPFRHGPLRAWQWSLSTLAPAFTILLCAGLVIQKYEGWKIPYVPWSAEVIRFGHFNFHYDQAHAGECFVAPNNLARFTAQACLSGPNGPSQYLLMGDSHADILYEGLNSVFPELHVGQATMAGCRPLIRSKPWANDRCVEFNKIVFGDYLARYHVKYVLLGGFWESLEEPELAETLTWIKSQGVEPIVFGPDVLYNLSLPRLVSISERNHDPAIYLRHRMIGTDQLDRELARLARDTWKVRYISFYEDMCDVAPAAPKSDVAARCPVFAGATASPMVKDDNHLSPQGSISFFREIKRRGQLP